MGFQQADFRDWIGRDNLIKFKARITAHEDGNKKLEHEWTEEVLVDDFFSGTILVPAGAVRNIGAATGGYNLAMFHTDNPVRLDSAVSGAYDCVSDTFGMRRWLNVNPGQLSIANDGLVDATVDYVIALYSGSDF